MIKRPININYYLKSKSIFFLWIILFFRIGFVFGQSDAPDINEVIKNKTPLEQIMELNELSRQYRNSDIESALNFCIKAYEISVTSDNKTGMAISLKNIGIIDYIIGRYDSALITRGECVCIFIHSSTLCEQAGTKSSLPSTSTTHKRQAPDDGKPCIRHNVGTEMPF
jgi:hypothetical protein